MNNRIESHTIEKSLAEIESELKSLDDFLVSESAVLKIKKHVGNIRSRLADPIHLVIENTGGVLQAVDAFTTTEQAERHFRDMTGFTYDAVCEWEKADRSWNLGIPRAQEFDVQIWEVTVKGDSI